MRTVHWESLSALENAIEDTQSFHEAENFWDTGEAAYANDTYHTICNEIEVEEYDLIGQTKIKWTLSYKYDNTGNWTKKSFIRTKTNILSKKEI